LRIRDPEEERMTAPQDPYSYPGGTDEPVRRPAAQIFSILAMVSGVLAILAIPILFGPIGIVLAVVANRKSEPLWKVGLAVAIVGMLLGFILGYLSLSTS
jgi:hypothetical protein